MACLGTINVVEKQIQVSITDGVTTLQISEGIGAEFPIDGSVLAMLEMTGDPLMKVNQVTGQVEGVLKVKDVPLTVTSVTELAGLSNEDVDAFAVSGSDVTVTLNGTPDLSAVRVGDYVEIQGATNAGNNGTFIITAVDDSADSITFVNANGVVEATDSPATLTVFSPAIHDVAATRDYCDCTGLCYVA